jgi:acyl-CoA thioester hydrolase
MDSQPAPVHQYTHLVQIHDTDCYGVVWHGSYSRWLETGRVALCLQLGIAMEKPGHAVWLYPVIDQHLQFKASATIGDTVTVQTQLALNQFKLVFDQQVLLAD